MSGRGGIYRGPNGEELYGDGREVSPSVAPGEAQREPTPPQCVKCKKPLDAYGSVRRCPTDGFHCIWSPAVPSEVAPSREQRLEDALRLAEHKLAQFIEGQYNWKPYPSLQITLESVRDALEAK